MNNSPSVSALLEKYGGAAQKKVAQLPVSPSPPPSPPPRPSRLSRRGPEGGAIVLSPTFAGNVKTTRPVQRTSPQGVKMRTSQNIDPRGIVFEPKERQEWALGLARQQFRDMTHGPFAQNAVLDDETKVLPGDSLPMTGNGDVAAPNMSPSRGRGFQMAPVSSLSGEAAQRKLAWMVDHNDQVRRKGATRVAMQQVGGGEGDGAHVVEHMAGAFRGAEGGTTLDLTSTDWASRTLLKRSFFHNRADLYESGLQIVVDKKLFEPAVSFRAETQFNAIDAGLRCFRMLHDAYKMRAFCAWKHETFIRRLFYVRPLVWKEEKHCQRAMLRMYFSLWISSYDYLGNRERKEAEAAMKAAGKGKGDEAAKDEPGFGKGGGKDDKGQGGGAKGGQGALGGAAGSGPGRGPGGGGGGLGSPRGGLGSPGAAGETPGKAPGETPGKAQGVIDAVAKGPAPAFGGEAPSRPSPQGNTTINLAPIDGVEVGKNGKVSASPLDDEDRVTKNDLAAMKRESTRKSMRTTVAEGERAQSSRATAPVLKADYTPPGFGVQLAQTPQKPLPGFGKQAQGYNPFGKNPLKKQTGGPGFGTPPSVASGSSFNSPTLKPTEGRGFGAPQPTGTSKGGGFGVQLRSPQGKGLSPEPKGQPLPRDGGPLQPQFGDHYMQSYLPAKDNPYARQTAKERHYAYPMRRAPDPPQMRSQEWGFLPPAWAPLPASAKVDSGWMLPKDRQTADQSDPSSGVFVAQPRSLSPDAAAANDDPRSWMQLDKKPKVVTHRGVLHVHEEEAGDDENATKSLSPFTVSEGHRSDRIHRYLEQKHNQEKILSSMMSSGMMQSGANQGNDAWTEVAASSGKADGKPLEQDGGGDDSAQINKTIAPEAPGPSPEGEGVTFAIDSGADDRDNVRARIRKSFGKFK
ncbi:unnamed protein product [Amoebophrya sp. A25]|nr:unnamed protein product [Amoebophrya sp. A25]|eukprot:GSA25T00019089001.1